MSQRAFSRPLTRRRTGRWSASSAESFLRTLARVRRWGPSAVAWVCGARLHLHCQHSWRPAARRGPTLQRSAHLCRRILQA
eukprot:7387965-Lingulodinium_polyedra.AAC.1